MAKKYQNAQQAADGNWYVYDDETGDQIRVIPISRVDDEGNMVQSFEKAGADPEKQAAMNQMGYTQARDAAPAPVNWTEPLPQNLSGFTVTANQDTVRPGDTVPVSTVADLNALGLSASASPIETMGLQEYLGQTGQSLQEYQAATGAQPFVFNNDGTAVYDPNAQTTKYEYTPASYAQNAMIGLGGIGLLAAAPAIMGALGAAPAAAAAAPAAEVAGAGALESFLNTVPATFGAEAAAPSLLSTGTLASTPVSALSGLSSVLPAGGLEALMAGAPLAMSVAGAPVVLDAAGNLGMSQIGGLAPELSTVTPASSIPTTGSFTQTLDLPAQQNPFIADTTPTLESMAQPAAPTAPTTPPAPPPVEPSILDSIKAITQNPVYQAVSAASTLSSVLGDSGAPVDFTDIVNGGIPSIDQSINAAVTGSGINMPTVAGTGASLGLPNGGLEAIMQNIPFNTTNPVTGLPTTLYPDGSSSVQQTGGAASNLSTPTPTPTGTSLPTGTTPPTPNSASSILSRLLDGTATTADWTQLLGQAASGALGYLGSQDQTQALTDLQNQLNAQRAPFLNKATGYLNDPNSFYTSPEATGAANAVLRQLSATSGNPAGSPTAQSIATGALYDRYLSTVNSLGSLGLSGQGIQANLGTQAAQSGGQPYAIAGDILGGLTSPSSNDTNALLQKLMKQMGSTFSLA